MVKNKMIRVSALECTLLKFFRANENVLQATLKDMARKTEDKALERLCGIVEAYRVKEIDRQ